MQTPDNQDKQVQLSNAEIFKRVEKVILETLSIHYKDISLDDTLFLGQEYDRVSTVYGSVLDFSQCFYPENSLGMKPLDGVELSMALEEEFDIEIPDEEFDGKTSMTIKELVDFIDLKLGNA
ncbi:phosphopantetheine-binding protein [Nostoc sp.]|uniref:phosphopantetheine-binding protein n=1 Tax=Nostoc sp. TaxID=1180 RepID=UPI003FA54AAE